MKAYFAKYLPVEGEIKDLIKDEFYQKFPEELPNYVPTKVKLFLCSRDVQVGDKIQCDETEYKSWICTQNDLDNCPLELIKVIGEISPDAIWVKEGDKFDEEQLRRPLPNVLNIVLEGKQTVDEILSKYPIQVLCPTCKTFH